MKRISIIMIFLSVLAKLFGFVREIVLSMTYQPGPLTDSFLFANSISGTIFAVVIAAFVTGFIPMFTRIEQEEGTDEANKFLNNTQNTMLLIGLVVSVFVFLFPHEVLSLLLRNATPEVLYYAIPFVRITIFTVMFSSVIQLMTGYLQIRGQFIIPALLSLPLNFVLIAAIILSKSTSPFILPIGIVLAYVVQTVIILWAAYRKGFKFKFQLDWKDKNLRRMIVLAIPLIIGSASNTISIMVTNSLVSGIHGGITYLNQAQRIGGLIDGIFGMAIVSVMYPALSSAVSENRHQDAADEFENSLISLLLFIVPCAIGMILLSEPIIQFIYMRGAFTQENVEILDPVFKAYSYGLIGISLNSLLVKVYYSYHDMKTPVYVAVFAVALQVILGIILVDRIGLKGASISMAVAAIVQSIILFVLVLKKFPDFNLVDFFKELSKVVVASLAMGITVYFTYYNLLINQKLIVGLIGSVGAAVVVYFVLLFVFRLNALRALLGSRKNKTA